jgi:HlyD family secretion protein
MDRPIERKRWSTRTLTVYAGGAAVVFILAFLVLDSPSGATIRIDPQRVTIATIREGDFHEFIPVIGAVEPIRTVFITAVEGGQVVEVLVEDGAHVERGELILKLENADVQKETIGTESRLFENLSQLRNTRVALAEKELRLKEELLDTDYRILQLEKQLARLRGIEARSAASIAEQELTNVADELDYRRGQKEIIEARIVQERTLREQQLEYVDATIERVERNLEIIAETLKNLEVHAPISGQLSLQRIETGQNIVKGDNIGQIDILDSMKVRARVDQYYLPKIVIGLRGEFEFDNAAHTLEVTKIYPDVADDMFEIDMEFVDKPPSGIRRGQSAQISLSLSDPARALLLRKGGFYNSTGGRWIYQLSPDGGGAFRQEIRVGRQNPQYFELVAGLDVGARVITSSYDMFGNASQIHFEQPVPAR